MSDERDVLAAFDALYEAATKTRDADAVVDLFAPDDDVTLWGSEEEERAVGRAELRSIAEAIASSSASLEFAWSERRARVEGDVAWVNAAGTVTVGDTSTVPYRVTAVFVRRDGGWLWHTHHGSEPNAALSP